MAIMARLSTTLGALAVLAAGLFNPAARAQEEPAAEAAPAPTASQSTDELQSDTITVIGRRGEGVALRDYAMDFVIEIGDPPTSHNGYARWGRRICIGVLNAPQDGGEFVADRIGEIATELGLKPQGPGCTPNIVIAFAADAKALAQQLVEEQPRRFRPFGGEGGTTQGLWSLSKFAESDAPVRWWQVTMVVDRMGAPAISEPGQPGGPTVVAGANSFIRNSVEDELWNATVIVDAPQVNGVSWIQLADYLAMVTLAQIDPEGSSAGYDSVLNLFESPDSVRGLTDWDWSYLRALYELDRRLMPRHQRGVLAGLIAREQQRLEEEE
jgi:hypothetical protein